jgi:hypothetical protein
VGEVKHEVGTRVRVNEPGDKRHGKEGSIIEIGNWKHNSKYTVLVDDRETWVSGRWYAPENLEECDVQEAE